MRNEDRGPAAGLGWLYISGLEDLVSEGLALNLDFRAGDKHPREGACQS